MPLIELTNLDDARLRVFSSMTDSELRDPKQLVGLRLATGSEVSDEGLFIAESRNVIDRAMDAGDVYKRQGSTCSLPWPTTPTTESMPAACAASTTQRTRGLSLIHISFGFCPFLKLFTKSFSKPSS